MSKKELNRNYG